MSRFRAHAVATTILLSVVTLVACTPATPEERVAELRSGFDARVNGFYVEAVPQVVEPVVETEVAEEEAEVAEEAEEVAEFEEPVPVIQNAHLDLIVQHDNDEMLSGITVEITMVDASQQEKGSWRLWVDTSTLRKANQLQLVHVLEDVAYVEGDGFSAEVRSPIPPEEYADYQEFSSLEG